MKAWLNESGTDRVIRIILGLVLLALGWSGVVSSPLGDIFKVLGFLPLITGIVGFCPAYALLKFRTNKA